MLSGWIRGPSGCMDLVYVFSIQQFRARHCFHSSRSGLLSFSYIPGLWGRKESDTTERLIWSDLILASLYIQSFRQPGLSVPVMGHMQPLSSMLVKLAGSGVVLLGWIMTPPLTDLVTRLNNLDFVFIPLLCPESFHFYILVYVGLFVWDSSSSSPIFKFYLKFYTL